MAVSKTLGSADEGRLPAGTSPHAAVVAAVKEDVRQTLRSAWIDPAIDVVAEYPVFFTAAWSAIRPNVGKSFLILARSLRAQAVESARSIFPPVDLHKELAAGLSEEELLRVEDCARAAYLVSVKSQIVVHALYRAARRERIAGTGGEEPPIRRGIPEWQRWMSVQPVPDEARPLLEATATALAVPSPPVPLRLFARWPEALSVVSSHLRPIWGTEPWTGGVTRLRRVVLAGITTLPHPLELQWGALKARGFTEDERAELVDRLAHHEAAMPGQTLATAFAWTALGAPDVGGEG
jgi:hypothetical protein